MATTMTRSSLQMEAIEKLDLERGAEIRQDSNYPRPLHLASSVKPITCDLVRAPACSLSVLFLASAADHACK